MRNSIRMFTVTGILVLGLVSLGSAQMMGGGNGHMSGMMSGTQADSTSQQPHMDMMGMMHNMSNQCKMMSSEFNNLEEHFNKMMKMDDMNALKAEMKKHQKMMQSMHQGMNTQENMCQNVMSMMHSGNEQGMMGMNSQNESKKSNQEADK
jgi:hypothetical protein